MRPSCASLASGRQVEPEVYPRPDGTVYVCGEPQTAVPLPPSPSLVTVEPQVNRTREGDGGFVPLIFYRSIPEARILHPSQPTILHTSIIPRGWCHIPSLNMLAPANFYPPFPAVRKRASSGRQPLLLAGIRGRRGAAGLLPTNAPRRPARHRAGPGASGRVRGNGPLMLGHSQRSRDGDGGGRADCGQWSGQLPAARGG